MPALFGRSDYRQVDVGHRTAVTGRTERAGTTRRDSTVGKECASNPAAAMSSRQVPSLAARGPAVFVLNESATMSLTASRRAAGSRATPTLYLDNPDCRVGRPGRRWPLLRGCGCDR